MIQSTTRSPAARSPRRLAWLSVAASVAVALRPTAGGDAVAQDRSRQAISEAGLDSIVRTVQSMVPKSGSPGTAVTLRTGGMPALTPVRIGIGAVHNPMHTHEEDHVIHMEFQGRVTKDDLTLGRFFKVWKREFNANCIFSAEGGSASGREYCNGSEGTLKMLVNGQENSEFEQYQMKDKDEIEIRYD